MSAARLILLLSLIKFSVLFLVSLDTLDTVKVEVWDVVDKGIV